MLVVEVDDIGSEPLQGCVGNFPDSIRSAIQTLLGISILEAELGRDYHLLTKGLDGLAHQFLIRKRAVSLSGIEKRHTQFERLPDERDRLLPLRRGAVTKTQSHTAEADGGHF